MLNFKFKFFLLLLTPFALSSVAFVSSREGVKGVEFETLSNDSKPDNPHSEVSPVPPTVRLMEAKFHTHDKLISASTHDRYILPVTFQSLKFTCDSPYPTFWKFETPPHDCQLLKDFKITKHRAIKIESFWDESTYNFSSTLTLNFKKPFSVPKIYCTRTKLAGGNLTTKIESFETNDTFRIEVQITPEYKGIPNYKEKRFGVNKNCTVKLQVHTETKQFKCWDNSKPQIIQCNNPDECNSVFLLDDHGSESACDNSTVSTEPCTDHKNCVQLKPSYSPAVIICQDQFNNSIARRYFAYPEYQEGNVSAEPSPKMRLGRDTEFSFETIRLVTNSRTIYFGKTVKFTCMGAGAYYSNGFQWGIQKGSNNSSDNNSSELVIQDGNNSSETFNTTFHSYQAEIILSFSRRSLGNYSHVTIICFAPRWNRYEWVNASLEVEVKEPERPTIIVHEQVVSDVTSVNVDGGESYRHTFTCVAKGKPRPEIAWTWNSNLLDNNFSGFNMTHESNQRGVIKSTLVGLLRRNDENVIFCKAFNFYAKNFYEFRVERANSKSLIIGSSISIAVILVLSVAAFFLTRNHYRKKLQWLSYEEIEEFENGNFRSDTHALILPYSMENEIPLTDITILYNSVLGEGQFGVVYKGLHKSRTVAIKSLKKTADVRMFKALLVEIKIFCYVGKHENLVNMVGACTRNMRQREVYLLTEYCENGNLLRFLKQSRGMCLDLFNTTKAANDYTKELRLINVKNDSVSVLPCVNTLYLVTWAYDITCAMEYLASKNVIHGDLAARNVLLTEGLVAKVGDFGLSKQVLGDYAIYVQEMQCPLPLKWLAIESLQDFEFSTQSDIWAFGIVLWEIFSLGGTPYPGIPQWTFESYVLLKNGYRMEKPPFSNDSIYAVMQSCWDATPKARPSFTKLKDFFQELVATLKKLY